MDTVRMGGDGPATQIFSGERVQVTSAGTPKRYYQHGWQSWSLAAWVDADGPLPVPQPRFLHPMQIDPAWAFHPRLNGSWVGAVEQPDGQVLLLGSLGLDAHVELDGAALSGWYEAGAGSWFVARGDETQVFSAYAKELGKRLGKGANRISGGVWSSWYSLYTDIDEQLLDRILDGINDLPFEVFQADDGWQAAVGDWHENGKFPSGMQALASRIRATGRRAGLWLAPLIAVKSSRLFRAHPEWFLRDGGGRLVSAGFNWGEPLYALDTTRPEVREWLVALMRQVREWGFDYLKLDFLYGAGLPGVRHELMPREEAMRQALQLLREGMGSQTFFLGCGVPILPALGICDGLRIGPDVWSAWENQGFERLLHNPAIPAGRAALRTSVNRLWLKTLVMPDPDVVYFRSVECKLTEEHKRLMQGFALICGFRGTSDPPQWLTAEEREELRRFLACKPRIEQLGPQRFKFGEAELDFNDAAAVQRYAGVLNAAESAVMGWLANHRLLVKFVERLDRSAARRRVKRLRQAL